MRRKQDEVGEDEGSNSDVMTVGCWVFACAPNQAGLFKQDRCQDTGPRGSLIPLIIVKDFSEQILMLGTFFGTGIKDISRQ